MVYSMKPVLFTLVSFAVVAFCLSASIAEDDNKDLHRVRRAAAVAAPKAAAPVAAAAVDTGNALNRQARKSGHGKQQGRGNVFNWNVDASSGKGGKAKKEEEEAQEE